MRPKTVKEIKAMPKDAIVNGFHGFILDVKEPFPQTEHDRRRGRQVQLVLVTDPAGEDKLSVALEDPAHHLPVGSPPDGTEIGLEADNGERGLRGLVVNRYTSKDGTEKVRLVVTKSGGGRVVIPKIQETVQRPAPGAAPRGAPAPAGRTKTRAMAEHLHYCVRLVDWVEDDDLRQRYATTLFIQSARDCLGDADRDSAGPPTSAMDAEIEAEKKELAQKLAGPEGSTEPESPEEPATTPEVTPEPDVDTAFATLMQTEPFHGMEKDHIKAAMAAMMGDMEGDDALKRARAKREVLLKPEVFAELVAVMAEPAVPTGVAGAPEPDPSPPALTLTGQPAEHPAELQALIDVATKKHAPSVFELGFTDILDDSLEEGEAYTKAVEEILKDPAGFLQRLGEIEEDCDDIPF